MGGDLLGLAAPWRPDPVSTPSSPQHVWGTWIVSINLIFVVEWLLDLPVLGWLP